VVLALELLLSTELAFTTALAIVVCWALALWLVPDRRPMLRASVRYLAGAYVVGGLITAPFVYYALTGFHGSSFTPPSRFVADLLSFATPPGNVLSGSAGIASAIARGLPHLVYQPEAYVGVPAAIIVILYAIARWRTPSGRWMVAVVATAFGATLGPYLAVAGHRLVPLPWRLVELLPAFNNTLPVRLSVYLELAVAVVVALWAFRSRSAVWR